MKCLFPLLLAASAALSGSALAQAVAPPPPAPPASLAQASTPVGSDTSRVRAFTAGPDGAIQSLYLSNGSVVTVTPDLGGQLSAVIHKGTRVSASGPQQRMNGQRILSATRVTVGSQAFMSQRPAAGPLPAGPMLGAAAPPRRAGVGSEAVPNADPACNAGRADARPLPPGVPAGPAGSEAPPPPPPGALLARLAPPPPPPPPTCGIAPAPGSAPAPPAPPAASGAAPSQPAPPPPAAPAAAPTPNH